MTTEPTTRVCDHTSNSTSENLLIDMTCGKPECVAENIHFHIDMIEEALPLLPATQQADIQAHLEEVVEPCVCDDCRAERFARVCDIIYRSHVGWPLEPDETNPHSHTSRESRAAAMKIFEVLGVE